MTNHEAFILVANLDLPERERGGGPRHSIVLFNRTGEIANVLRYKWPPREEEIQEVLPQYPGCLHVVIEAGSCQLERTLGRAIRRQLRQMVPAVNP